ncbi:hAT transposon superfamily protein [Striga hermonthica]|uniref:HAT transposon superfamily protein n=1 Tax=Striga hermonthica TaxID=68872 RepID=A0A9N7ML98_STRHE|nr:hAT transposon superfamily protein [Striga hermonthica]
MEPPSSGQPAAVEKENVLKRKSDDVGWDYGFLVDSTNMNKVKCKLCGHESSGGIYRLKQHIAHVGTTVAKCKDNKPEDKDKCKKSLDGAAMKKREKIVRELNLREDVNVSRVEGGTEEEVTCIGSTKPHNLWPIDKWTRPIDPKSTQAEALKQQKLNKELWKQRTHEVQRYVARWMYAHAIGQFGVGFEPPSHDQLRGGLLAEEYSRTKSLLLERDAEKIKNGCSVLTDAWSDKKRRSIMTLCTNCADGTSFISSKDMSNLSHTSEVIFELVDKAIEEVDPDNVVQVVTDNASNNMGAKKLLFHKRPNIFWTSCAAHTINLVLQGIGSLERFKNTIDQAKAFTIFVYGHTRTLECMRQFTEGKEIIRPGVTRFASAFLTLNNILEKKDELRKMVVHSKWDTLREVKSKKGKDATTTMMNPDFWKAVKMCLKVF